MLYILLTILCSTTIALILKHNAARGGQPVVLLAGNYLVAAIISFGIMLSDEGMLFVAETFVFGVVLAALFVFSFFAFARALCDEASLLFPTPMRRRRDAIICFRRFFCFLLAFITVLLAGGGGRSSS